MEREHPYHVMRQAILAGERAGEAASIEYIRNCIFSDSSKEVANYGSSTDSALHNITSSRAMKSFKIIDSFSLSEQRHSTKSSGLMVGRRAQSQKFLTQRGIAIELNRINDLRSVGANTTFLNRHSPMWAHFGIINIQVVTPTRHHYFPGEHLGPMMDAYVVAYTRARLDVEKNHNKRDR